MEARGTEILKFLKPERLSIQNHPQLNEGWIQQQIAENPSILGLGDLILKDKERLQPRAGRLDLLLQDAETNRRYEVEVQLGKTDESHIIRTIEYWDIERKRYPQYDHCAVIVAEEMTARFLNVISLFNGTIPLIAIQMNAFRLGDQVTLLFTTVLDELTRGLVDEDEEVQAVTDRAYWEQRGSPASVMLADEVLGLIHTLDGGFELKYNKFYIGLAKGEQVDNFAYFRAKKRHLILEIKLKASEELDEELERAAVDSMGYNSRDRTYRIRLGPGDVSKHSDLLLRFLKLAYENSR